MEIILIEHGSDSYIKMVALRTEILRKPLNLVYTQEQLSLEKSDLLVAAQENNEVYGCCILTQLPENQLQLRQMAVASELQGKGVGAMIIGYAESLAREKNQKVIVLHARETAVDFYKKLGFSVFGNVFIEVGIKHFMMQKQLV
jgi:predicted GNAT family N-acyltransferase